MHATASLLGTRRVKKHGWEAIPLACFLGFSLLAHGVVTFLTMHGTPKHQQPLPTYDFVSVVVVSLGSGAEPENATDRTRDASSPLEAAPPPEWAADKVVDAMARPVQTTETTFEGGKGSGLALDIEQFPFMYYLNVVRNKISSTWLPPRTHASIGDTLRARIHFVIRRGGEVTRVVVEEQSSVPFFDQSALRAVYASDPLPPLPEEFTDAELGVHFTFEFVP